MKGKSSLVMIFSLLLVLGLAGGIGGLWQGARAEEPAPPGTRLLASPVGTAFTYQGRLVKDGNPVSGTCDFEFSLWDAESAGAQVGTTLPKTNVTVSDGLFTVQLDFGGGAFQGDARWLKIDVRCPEGSGSYTALSPRQELTPSPYALYATSAPWSGLTGVPGGFADGVDDDTTYSDGNQLNLVGTTFNVVEGSGSGLDADYLDGEQASAFAGVTHDHDTTYWSLTGNAATDPASNFLGTTDAVSLTLAVSSTAALRLEPTTGTPNLIGGYSGNSVTDGVVAATIGGGGDTGNANRVTDNYGTVGGGRKNLAGDDAGTTTDATTATVGGGAYNSATGLLATIAGGESNLASGSYATVPGGFQAEASLYGQMAHASGKFANRGDAQASLYVLRRTTTDATPTELFLDGSDDRLTIASNRALTFDILVVARCALGYSAGYHIQGVIEKDVGGTTSFIGTPAVTTLGEDFSAWDVAVQADDTNDALVIQVTGPATVTTRWVATVRTAEVAY